MGARLHFPRDGAKVGALRIDDPRAKLARIQIDRGDGKGKVDVTLPWLVRTGDMEAGDYAMSKLQVVAAHDIEGWIAVLNHRTTLIEQQRGDVTITFELSDTVRKARCDHTFVDSACCLKCGWVPPKTTQVTH